MVDEKLTAKNPNHSVPTLPWQLVLSVFIGVGLVARLGGLGFQSLWFDEVSSVVFAKQDSLAQIVEILRGDFHPPIYFVALHLWMELVGGSDFAVRLFSALVSMGSVVIFSLLALRVTSREKAVAAVGIASTALSQIWYAQEVRPYGLVSLLTLLVMYSLVGLVRPNSHTFEVQGVEITTSGTLFRGARPWQLLYVVSLALLLWTNYLAILLLLALQVIFFTMRQRRMAPLTLPLKKWLVLHSVVLLLFAPCAIYLLRDQLFRSSTVWLPRPSLTDLLELPLQLIAYRSAEHFAQFYSKVAAWCVIALLWALFFRGMVGVGGRKRVKASRADSFERVFLGVWFLGPILSCWIISQSGVHLFQPKTVMFTAFPLYLLLVEAIWQISPRSTIRYGLTATLCAISIVQYPWYYTVHHKEDWRGVANFLSERDRSPDEFIIEGPWTQLALAHYFKQPINLRQFGTQPSATKVWLIKAESPLTKSEIVANFSSVGYEGIAEKSYPGITIYAFRRR